jgi:hypothetical protein
MNSGRKKFYNIGPRVLVIAFLLAITSVIPIIVVAVLRMSGILKFDSSQYTVPMRRTDTNASTHPMMVRHFFYSDNFYSGKVRLLIFFQTHTTRVIIV